MRVGCISCAPAGLQGGCAVFAAPVQLPPDGPASTVVLRLGRGAALARECAMPAAHLHWSTLDGGTGHPTLCRATQRQGGSSTHMILAHTGAPPLAATPPPSRNIPTTQ